MHCATILTVSDYESRLLPVLCDWADHRYLAAIGRERLNGRERPSLAICTRHQRTERMTTASNSSATLLLVTGLLSVSMAAMGYYYLHVSSKKPLDNEAAGVHNGEKAPAACPFSRGLTEEEKRSGAKCPVTGMLASFTGGGENASEKKTTASDEEQKTEPASPKKEVESLKTEQEVVEAPVKEVEAPVAVEKIATSPKKEIAASPKKEVVASPKKEVAASPKKEIAASPKREIAASPKKEVAASLMKEVVASPNKEVAASPKKTPKSSPKKTVESPKKEVEPPVLELPEPAHSSMNKAPESSKKETEPIMTDSPKQAATSPKKTPESPKKSLQSPKTVAESVARKLSEDFAITQAVSETASAFAEELVQESLENVTLEQEEYVQVELTQSMTLSQSIPELINIEDAAVANVEEEISQSAATEDEESIVEEEQDQVPVEPASAEPVVEAPAVPAAVASPTGPRATSTSWEAITSSPVVKKATPAEEPAPALSLDTPAENAETEEPLSINVPAENSEASAADDKDDASSPVSSGGSSPGRRNRNRSKKSKSKKKKGKKKFKA